MASANSTEKSTNQGEEFEIQFRQKFGGLEANVHAVVAVEARSLPRRGLVLPGRARAAVLHARAIRHKARGAGHAGRRARDATVSAARAVGAVSGRNARIRAHFAVGAPAGPGTARVLAGIAVCAARQPRCRRDRARRAVGTTRCTACRYSAVAAVGATRRSCAACLSAIAADADDGAFRRRLVPRGAVVA